MAETVIMPKLGFNMTEGKLVKWHKKEGEPVNRGDTFFEITTDKTNIEIEATAEGLVRKILVEEGEVVPVTLTVAIVGTEHEDITQLVSEALAKLGKPADDDTHEPAMAHEVIAAEKKTQGENFLKITPRAQRLILEKNLNLSEMQVKGTGFEGGITEKDILHILNEQSKQKITPVANKLAALKGIDINTVTGSGINQKIMKADIQRSLEVEQAIVTPQASSPKEVREVIPYTGMRKVIGDRLSHSKFTSPHVYFSTSVDLSNLNRLKEEIKNTIENKVSLNDFILAGVTAALGKHPMLNASLEDDKIVVYKSINIGVAVGIENGLIVPVVKNAQDKKLSQIAEVTSSLIAKARAGKLIPDDYSGGTFTISNLGMYDIENFTAIINPPETAILAVSAAKKTPMVISDNGQDQIAIRPVMKITLSVDHRIIDGIAAAKFLRELKDLLENPIKMLV